MNFGPKLEARAIPTIRDIDEGMMNMKRAQFFN